MWPLCKRNKIIREQAGGGGGVGTTTHMIQNDKRKLNM